MAGRQASTTANHMANKLSSQLGLTPHIYASDSATMANGIQTQAEQAIADTSYTKANIKYAIVTGGLQDQLKDLATIITKTRNILNLLKRNYPNARIIIGACPGSIADMTAQQLSDNSTILSAILAETRNADALPINLREVCGTDASMQANGIYPNDAGHEALANALLDLIEEDRGEPVDEPIVPARSYGSALTDWSSRQVEATRRREAEKREANRPTGTELGGVTEKLDQLTQAQGVQQVLLEQQQDALERQQKELEKQQGKLDEQQKALKAAQDQLKRQQETLDKQQEALKGVVDEQGGQVNTLQNLTKSLQEQDKKIDTIQRTLYDNQEYLDDRIDKLTDRVKKLENGTSA